MGQSSELNIRISDVERNEAMSALGEHLASGRLELDEYDERCAVVMAARWRNQLEELFTDLPAPHPDLSSAVPPEPPRKSARLRGTRPTADTKPTGGTRPARAKDAKAEEGGKIVDTPLSRALDNFGGSVLMVGLPGGIVLTVMYGAWWTFFVIGGVVAVTLTVSDLVKRRPEG